MLNVRYRVRDVALLKYVLVFTKFEDRFPRTLIGEKEFGIKHLFAGFPKWPPLARPILSNPGTPRR
jgi:hypothetical protein